MLSSRSLRGSRLVQRGLVFVALLQVAGLSTSDRADATAADVNVSADSSSVSGDGGTTVTLTATAPVAAAGTIQQTITQSFDPNRLRLSGSSGIVAPNNWTLTYSSDGVNFGVAPSSPAGWEAVRSVRATGSITSGGDSTGLQIAVGSAVGSVPASGAFSSAGGGDGWDVAFDERGHVFNTFHHDGYWGSGFTTPGVDCHTRTGGSCGPGWPFALRVPDGVTGPDGLVGQPWYHTNDESMQWVDTVNNRIWVPTNLNDTTAASGTGFVCIDISDMSAGPAWCGGSIRNAFVKLGPALCGRNCNLGLAVADGLLFSWDTSLGKLLCLDPLSTRSGVGPGAPCTGQPFSVPNNTAFSSTDGFSLMAAQGNVWGSAGTRVMCFDPTALALCQGWTGSQSVSSSATAPNFVLDIPTASGASGVVCFARFEASRDCFLADGSSSTPLSSPHGGTALMNYVATTQSQQIVPKHAVTAGTRVYYADGRWPGGGSIHCWDTSLNSGTGGACPNWPVAVSAYTATIDSQNENCIWTNTDSGAITTRDAVTGAATCTTPPPTAEFPAEIVVPRLACTTEASIQAWRSFTLTGPDPTTYSSATLTILTSAGQVISGWNQVAIPSGTRSVDLSSLTVIDSGLNPRFRVSLANKTSNDLISAEVAAIGQAPELCLPLETLASCPAAPSYVAGPLASPEPLTIIGDGTIQPQSGPSEQLAPGTTSITVTPPADTTCLGSIGGVATMSATSAPMTNTSVKLLDSSGNVLATTETDNTGSYQFDRLVAGTGYRVEFGTAASGAADASTVADALVDRTVTATSLTTVNGTYALLRTNALSASVPHGQPARLTPAPHDSNGVQDYDAFTPASTCIIDPSGRQCRQSVAIAGEGVWVVDTTDGTLLFTPDPDFSGQTTEMRYWVTESASSWTTWNTAVVTVAAPIATTTTTTTTSTAAPTTTTSATTTTTMVPVTPPPAPTALPPAPITPTPQVTPSAPIPVTASGFTPGVTAGVFVIDDADTEQIASVVADDAGAIETTVTIPAGVCGDVTLAVWAPDTGEGYQQALTVSGCVLPATGRSLNMVVLSGLAVMMVGAVLAGRRRPI